MALQRRQEHGLEMYCTVPLDSVKANEGPVLFLFFIQAVFDTLKWPDTIEHPQFMSQYSAAATSQSAHFYGRCDFTFWSSLFADDCALIFRSHAESVEGLSIFTCIGKNLASTCMLVPLMTPSRKQ